MATFSQWVLRKIPSRGEALPVFSIGVAFIYSWSLFRMFYEIPSWLYYLGLQEILVLVAYTLAFALVESLLLFGFICLLNLCMPFRAFKQFFVAQGCLLAGVICLAAITIQRRLGWLAEMESYQVILFPIIFVALLLLTALVAAAIYQRYAKLPQFFQRLGDRLSVFSYLYVPLGVLSLALVIMRNLS